MVGGAALSLTVRFRVKLLVAGAVGFAYLLLVSGAVLPPLLAPAGAGSIDLDQGLPVLQGVLAGVILLAAALFAKEYWLKDVGELIGAAWLPLTLFGFAFLSSLWSADPDLTIRRAVALGGSVLVALLLVGVYGFRRTVVLTGLLLGLLMLASAVVALVLPDIGVHQTGSHVGRWRGWFLHKNLLGREAALASSLLLVLGGTGRRWARVCAFALLPATLLVLWKAESATGIGAAIGTATLLMIYRVIRGRPLLGAAFVGLASSAAVLLGFVTVFAPDRLVGLLNRDLSFTGRTRLWEEVLALIRDSPLLGHGYRGFWGTSKGDAISAALGWRVSHAHNGWLEVGLDLGLIGLLLIVLLFAIPLIRYFGSRLAPPTFEAEVALAVGSVTLLVAASDSVLLGPNNLFFFLLVAQFVALRFAPPARAGRRRAGSTWPDASSAGGSG